MGEKELEVLKQYEIDVKNVKKVRGAFLCDTKQGLYLLKEMDFSEKRIPVLQEIFEGLHAEGINNVDYLIKNKEERFYSESPEDEKYILKRWFSGKECDIRKESDVLQAVRHLGELHLKLNRDRAEESFQKESLEQEIFRHNRELKKVRSFIRSKVRKGDFETIFLASFDAMYECAEKALVMLKELELSQLPKSIVHGDYNYHNILMTPSGIATTNFEHFYYGTQIDDLYYFLRKTMEKNQWNVQLGYKMIDAYHKVKTIRKEELTYIAIYMTYPEKFWKAANSYYRSRKSWVPAKSLEKLEMSIKQNEDKRVFLEEVLQFKE